MNGTINLKHHVVCVKEEVLGDYQYPKRNWNMFVSFAYINKRNTQWEPVKPTNSTGDCFYGNK